MPKTVLLADDSVTIQKVVGITFANEDIDLVTVDNGTDALARARQIVPDLLLADIGMPGMNGYDLCAAIRRTPQLAHIPVLLLTGTFESYDEARARAAGASGHISKPFEAQALVDRVWALLNAAETARGVTRVADASDVTIGGAGRGMAEDSAANLPELPNSSFGTAPTASRSSGRLPRPEVSDLHDLSDSGSRHRTRPPAPASFFDALADTRDEVDNGETAFLDPLPELASSSPARAAEPPAPRLPPAEPPDLLDLSGFDPQGDTNPTYADGSTIGSDAVDGPDDPHVASGESIALVLPDIPEFPGLRSSGGPVAAPPPPLLDAQVLTDADPLDLEPLAAPEVAAAEPLPVQAVPAPSAVSTAPALDRDALHGALEKLAWEAFGSLSQELVEQFTRRVEAIVWEIVPPLAERLVRAEIERLKGEV